MEKVFAFVDVPDLYHCLSPCFRKLVSAFLRLLYSHLSKNVRDLYAAREIVEDNSDLGYNLIYKTTLLGVKKVFQFKTTLNVQSFLFKRKLHCVSGPGGTLLFKFSPDIS